MIHARGTVWIPKPEFFEWLFKAIELPEDLPPDLDFIVDERTLFFHRTYISGHIVPTVAVQHPDQWSRFTIDSAPFFEFVLRYVPGAESTPTVVGPPRLETHDLVMTYLSNSEDPVQTTDFPSLIDAAWKSHEAITGCIASAMHPAPPEPNTPTP